MKGLFKVALPLLLIAAGVAVAIVRKENSYANVAFTLTNHDGQTTTQSDLAGAYLLVFFGFTHCPKVCPTTMAKLTKIVEQLDLNDPNGNVTPVFISVDAKRDTVPRVKSYIQHFHSRFVGLTGSEQALADAAKSFGTGYAAQKPNDTGQFNILHSGAAFVVDPSGQIITVIPARYGVPEAVSLLATAIQ